MIPRCDRCPASHLKHCPAIEAVCDRIATDDAARAMFLERVSQLREFAVEELDPPPLVPLAVSMAAVRLGFRKCLYSTHEGCGCTGTHCYHLGRVVNLTDCIDCLGIVDRPNG